MNPSLKFIELRDLYRGVYDSVHAMHQASPSQHDGHSFEHDVLVAMIAVDLVANARPEELGDYDRTALVDLVFIAGLVHSTDRKVENGTTLERLVEHLRMAQISPAHQAIILVAVQRHSEFKDKNLATRGAVQKFLMDADKLANMQLAVVIRSSQFHPSIAAIEPEFIGKKAPDARYYNSASTYPNPKSVIDVLLGCTEWMEPGWFHCEGAKAEAQRLGTRILDFIREAEEAYVRYGIAGVVL